MHISFFYLLLDTFFFIFMPLALMMFLGCSSFHPSEIHLAWISQEQMFVGFLWNNHCNQQMT